MRISTLIVSVLVSTVLLLSCRQQPSPEVNPTLGRDCFEAHQDALPPGSQYEGIAKVSENRVTIGVMTGIKVESFTCVLAANGKVRLLAD